MLLLAGCSATGLHRPASAGFVEGLVTTVQGEPVAGAVVTAVARPTPFASVFAQDSARSDAAGHYRILLRTAQLMESDAVVALSVRAPAGAPLGSADTSIVAVHFSPASPPPDTTRIGFHLPYLPD